MRLRAEGEGYMVRINLHELTATVMTAYVMVVMNGDRPESTGEAVLMKADSAVAWVKQCRGRGRKNARVGAW